MIIHYPVIEKKEFTSSVTLKDWMSSFERLLDLKPDEIKILVITNYQHRDNLTLEPIATPDHIPTERINNSSPTISGYSHSDIDEDGKKTTSNYGIFEPSGSDKTMERDEYDVFEGIRKEIKRGKIREENRRCPIFCYYLKTNKAIDSISIPKVGNQTALEKILNSNIEKIQDDYIRIKVRTNVYIGHYDIPFYEIDINGNEIADDESLIEEIKDHLSLIINEDFEEIEFVK
jgi:hypothetical protein